MDASARAAQETDLHRLELRFAETRLIDGRAVERLARSIEQCGQLVPCIAVIEAGAAQWILIDGYRRVEALRRLGRDTAWVQASERDLTQALLSVLAGAGARPWAPIEEALLVHELIHSLGQSEREIARGCGRDVSWVSRRRLLLSGLPGPILEAVRHGTVSSWAATRVLAPLARANGEHAQQLLAALMRQRWSTRELRAWFEHYQRGSKATRERMVEHPRLVLEAARAADQQRADERLRCGPEGEWMREARHLLALIARLRSGLPALLAAGLPDSFKGLFPRLCASLDALRGLLQRSLDHGPGSDPPERANDAAAGTEPARDQSTAQAVA